MSVLSKWPLPRVDQESVVLAITAVLFLVFSVTLKSFLTASNVLSLVQNVAILGVLGIAMAQVIIGRGIDLSIVANMAVSVALVLQLANAGVPTFWAVLAGLAVALTIGLINGILVAYVGIPAIFATLAMGAACYGFVLATMLKDTLVSLQVGEAWFRWIGGGRIFEIPSAVVLFGAVAGLMHLFLRYTVPGRFIYAMGDNPTAARTSGVPMSGMVLLQYTMSAGIAFLAGVIMATSVNSMETRFAMTSFSWL
jgi:ribose transport system permease protein